MIDQLNAQFGLGDQLVFGLGPGDLPLVEIMNEAAMAVLSLHGGHVLAYQPLGQKPVLWVSKLARFQHGEAIRGGIPVIWPWFGAHPTDSGRPSHGFARRSLWRVRGATAVSPAETQLRLGLQDNEETRLLWPHAFDLDLTVTVGAALHLSLRTQNKGPEAFTFTSALHSYFTVSTVTAVSIAGLEDAAYIDQLAGMARRRQSGAVQISSEVDNVYVNTEAACRLIDPYWQRTIAIHKQGSRSTVVWNPWRDKAQRMADFGDDEYRQMVCIETANAAENEIRLAPGDTHEMQLKIFVEKEEET